MMKTDISTVFKKPAVVLNNAYPILLTISIVLFPFINNMDQLNPYEIIIPLFGVLIPVLCIYWLAYRGLKDVSLVGVVISTGVLIFFSFQITGHVLPLFEKLGVKWPFLIRLALISAFLIILLIASLFLLIKILIKHQAMKNFVVAFFNFFTIAFFIIQLFLLFDRIHYFTDNANFQKQWAQSNRNLLFSSQMASPTLKRDIYVIVLDAYTTTEVLQKLYNYDNTWFISELESRGFYVIPQAKSNYSQTRTSTNSLLNMQYLDKLTEDFGEEYRNAMPLMIMLKNNRVMLQLKELGYRTVTYETDYAYTDAIMGDINHKDDTQIGVLGNTLITQTVIYPLFHEMLFAHHREVILKSLKPVLHQDGPSFQFIHVFAPHPPFVFDREGNPTTPEYIYTFSDADALHKITPTEYYQSRYPMQLEYISKQVLATIDYIKSNSTVEPIIILMGDHGPGTFVYQIDVEHSNHYERMHILNAFYLPGVNPRKIPVDITPVNTFRFIFNEYFDANLPLLENRSFASSYITPYKFIDVTEASEISNTP